jgi:hypothetical protein
MMGSWTDRSTDAVTGIYWRVNSRGDAQTGDSWQPIRKFGQEWQVGNWPVNWKIVFADKGFFEQRSGCWRKCTGWDRKVDDVLL